MVADLVSGEVYDDQLADRYKALRKRTLEQPDREDDALFLQELYFGTQKQRKEFETLIKPKLNNWDWERVAWVDRILLLMGLYEMLFMNEIPVKVTIDEYIEIAKEYSSDKSSPFINGILDALHHELLEANRINKIGQGPKKPDSTPAP